MSFSSSSPAVDIVSCPFDDAIAPAFLAGQMVALRGLGVEAGAVADRHIAPGTIALLARDAAGKLIGGVKICVRSPGWRLPLESAGSPLPAHLRRRVAAMQDACEFRGLWVDNAHAGLALGRTLILRALEQAGADGHASVVGLAHWRSYTCVLARAGFDLLPDMPSLAYPDARFRSVVIWRPTALDVREAA